jgi:hypothetical protein
VGPAPDAAADPGRDAAAAPDAGASPDSGGAADLAALPDAAADMAGPDTQVATAANSRYSFETSLQGWKDQHFDYFGQPATKVVRSTARAWDGLYGIEIALRTTASYRTPEIGVAASFGTQLRAGSVISYHLWFPADGSIEGVQPYVFYYRAGASAPDFGGIDPILFADSLNPGGWTTVTFKVPADVDVRGVTEVGLEWRTNGARSVNVYLDAVTW